jgi:hypothetical protein
MLEYLVAVSGSDFRFDNPVLIEAARSTWPDVALTIPEGPLSGRVDAYLDLTPHAVLAPQVELMTGGRGIGIEAPTREEAAGVLAWLCRTGGLPDDGSVVVIHWSDAPLPLHPGMTQDELLRID